MSKMEEGTLYQKGDVWYVKYESKDDELPINKSDVNLSNDKRVRFEVCDVYVEPPGDIHPNRGGYKKMANIIPQIESIKIGEGCFGSHVIVDGKSLCEEDFSTEEDIKEINKNRLKLFKELELLLPKLDMYDLRVIAEVVVSRGQWENKIEDSYQNSCDQCGNYNWNETYNR